MAFFTHFACEIRPQNNFSVYKITTFTRMIRENERFSSRFYVIIWGKKNIFKNINCLFFYYTGDPSKRCIICLRHSWSLWTSNTKNRNELLTGKRSSNTQIQMQQSPCMLGFSRIVPHRSLSWRTKVCYS